MADSFPVGQAPWEQTPDPHPDSFPVGLAPWEQESLSQKASGYLGKGIKALNSVTIDPVNAGISAAQKGDNPISAVVNQFANTNDKAPTGEDIMKKAGLSDKSPGALYTGQLGDIANQYNLNGERPSPAKVAGSISDVALNPINAVGPVLRGAGKAINFLTPAGEAIEVTDKASPSSVAAAAKRLGFEASLGMTSNSETVQGLESSLSQEPGIGGNLVRRQLAPIDKGMQAAAEDLVSGADTSAYGAGADASKGVLAKLGEQANNIKMSYEPFNQELPKMIPAAEDKWQLADQIAKIGDQHLDPNEVQGIVRGTTNKIMGSGNLADIEETRKLLGNKINQAYSSNDRNMVDTLNKIKDKLSDFRDTQFQKLAEQAYPTPEGSNIGQQMVSQYQNAMKAHADMMNDLRDVGPLFGIKAKNPRDFIESFSEIPPEQVAKKLFQSNDYDALQKVQAYFPEEFNSIKNLKLQELRGSSLSNPIDPTNSPVSPQKLISKVNKLSPEVRTVLFGDKAQKVQDMQTLLGAYPEYIGPSGTPKGEMFMHWPEIPQQAGSIAKYIGYRTLGSAPGGAAMKAASALPGQVGSVLQKTPNLVGPAVSAGISASKGDNYGK